MRKSIELGRAVLSTPAVNLELWLKTLITISPQQHCTDLEQHNAASLLDTLSSGKVWVGRGNGLYIELEITFRHRPVADEQLRQLSEGILAAPVSVCKASVDHSTYSEFRYGSSWAYNHHCPGTLCNHQESCASPSPTLVRTQHTQRNNVTEFCQALLARIYDRLKECLRCLLIRCFYLRISLSCSSERKLYLARD